MIVDMNFEREHLQQIKKWCMNEIHNGENTEVKVKILEEVERCLYKMRMR